MAAAGAPGIGAPPGPIAGFGATEPPGAPGMAAGFATAPAWVGGGAPTPGAGRMPGGWPCMATEGG